MTAIRAFAEFIDDVDRTHCDRAIEAARNALTDTVGCIYAGCSRPVSVSALRAFEHWGVGESIVIARQTRLIPPFAALVNAAAAHALDYDDYDAPANAHPSAVIFPALFAVSTGRKISGSEFFDAYIVGVEILQRLGEAMNMAHYRQGWHTTVTLGSIAAAGACARLMRFDKVTSGRALSLGASMASALTNQGGYQAKPLHAGFAAKNAVMAARFAESGVSASEQVIDGSTSLARAMGDYVPEKFANALAKLGQPWSILEHGLIAKAYPSCGYTHRLIDAAIELRQEHDFDTHDVTGILVSVPDYYLDLLTFPDPTSGAEAMFSAEYNVAAALVHTRFDLSCLQPEQLNDPEIRRLCRCTTVEARRPLDPDVTYDPRDPDLVILTFADGTTLRREVALPTGAPAKPMSEQARRSKFDAGVTQILTPAECNTLYESLQAFERVDDIASVLESMR